MLGRAPATDVLLFMARTKCAFNCKGGAQNQVFGTGRYKLKYIIVKASRQLLDLDSFVSRHSGVSIP